MATIKDLSRISGLAVGTISRYINGYEVKDTTKAAIEQAIIPFTQYYGKLIVNFHTKMSSEYTNCLKIKLK